LNGLFAIDARYGDVLWRLESGRDVVLQTGDTLIVRETDGGLAAVNRQTGEVESRTEVPRGLIVARNTQDTTLFASSPEGRLFCGRPKGAPPLTVEELQAAHATLNQPPKTETAPQDSEEDSDDSAESNEDQEDQDDF
jgi:hypothetical protein